MKKYIEKVTLTKDVIGLGKVGDVFETSYISKHFPYIDYKNKDFFELVFDTAAFKKGDIVMYIGSSTHINKNVSYIISKVIPFVRYGNIDYTYQIERAYGSVKEKFEVYESSLDKTKEKWIVSFSQQNIADMPGILKLDYTVWYNKIRKTWKNMFVFDTQSEATEAALFFSKHSIKDIIKIMKD